MQDFITVWKILAIISFVFLVFFWSKKNSIWGGLTLGIIVGLIVAIVHKGFDWHIILKGGIIGILIGAVLELVSIIGEKTKKQK